MKEYWAFYNSQLIHETKIFAENTISRMRRQADRFIKMTTENYGNLLKLWDNLRQNVVEGKKEVVISIGISKTRKVATKKKPEDMASSKISSEQEKVSPKNKGKESDGNKPSENIFYEDTSSEEIGRAHV